MSLGIFYLLKILAFLTIGFLFNTKISAASKIHGLRSILIFFSLCVYVEFLISAFGFEFGLHSIIFPMSRADGNLIDIDSLLRFSGWQVEPGYHSVIILISLILEDEYTRKSNIKKISKFIIYISLLSIILSGSALGIILSLLWVVEKASFVVRKNSLKSIGLLFLAALVLVYVSPYFQTRFDDLENYRSLNAKIAGIDLVFGRDIMETIVGSGFSYETDLHVKDLGLLISNFMRFGLLGLLVSLVLLKRVMVRISPKYTSMAIIASMKIGVLYIPFWIIFVELLSQRVDDDVLYGDNQIIDISKIKNDLEIE
jgi:hypothetical protein